MFLPESAKLLVRDAREIPAPAVEYDSEAFAKWLDGVGACLGFEPVCSLPEYGSVEQLLSACGPTLIQVDQNPAPRFLLLLNGGRRKLDVLTPDFQVHRVPLQVIREGLLEGIETPHLPAVKQTIERANMPAARKRTIRRALLKDRLARTRLSGWWSLQVPAGADLRTLLRASGLSRQIAGFLAAHGLQVLLWVASWYLIGYGALQGRLDFGWLAGWALLLLTMVPLRLVAARLQASITVAAGVLLRRCLLEGAMNQRLDEVRHQGIGQLLGRVIECETVEVLSLNGGLVIAVALAELLVAAVVLSQGQGGLFHTLLLCLWMALTAALTWRYYHRREAWTASRLESSEALVEDLVGYRTRLVQGNPARWSASKDRALENYFNRSLSIDESAASLWLIPRGWLVVGLLGIAPAFVSGQHTVALLAVALGGILLAQGAFESLVVGLPQLAGAVIAWKKVKPLFQDGLMNTRQPARSMLAPQRTTATTPGQSIIEACNLSFRYREKAAPVIEDCGLVVNSGDHILLQGSSGGGKSTLASLLAGVRVPDTGTLLLNGLDHQTLGYQGWRDRVAAAPQFHDNFAFANTLAFNLLLGRRWPPSTKDLEEANQVCRELGLDDLIARMPGGLFQLVGENGWQLSHGERSRLYIARALLRKSSLLILDESFSAVDPDTLQHVLSCVLNRTPTLLVVSHA